MNNAAIGRKLMELGLSPRHKGFYVISSMLITMLETGSGDPFSDYCTLCEMMIRSQRGSEQSVSYAIRYAWDTSCGSIRSMFPYIDYPPSPKEFILTFLTVYKSE